MQCKNNGLGRNSTWDLINRDAKQTGAKVTARAGPLFVSSVGFICGWICIIPSGTPWELAESRSSLKYVCVIFKNSHFCLTENTTRLFFDYADHEYEGSTLFRNVFFLWRCYPTRVMASSFLRFLEHTQRRNTVGRTPLDE